MPLVTRFAPSPTGSLHLGHAFSALFASEAARAGGGRFLLRIEDIDPVRCRPEFTEAIFEDLRWLGLTWEEPVLRQSGHMEDYAAALAKLSAMGLLYPCFCTRREIEAEVAASAAAPHLALHGPDGPVYPGTCRARGPDERAARLSRNEAASWRLDAAKAFAMTGPLFWSDRAAGRIEAAPLDFGDVVLARKDAPASYHLAVAVDDHRQGVTLVTRGADLFRATDIQRLLQALLGYAPPDYHHHGLLTDAAGRRFAKRDRDVTLRGLREAGKTAAEVRDMAARIARQR
ncbi:MAG: tRNA glutamyl-Q(34) synthetase GluQRS [Rhodomicrobium sp.]|jgi:glutamyl-Q tRNA(Asp) synthetase